MRSKWTVVTSVLLVALLVACTAKMTMAQPATQPAAAAQDPFDEFVQKTKNPFPGFNWGMDLPVSYTHLTLPTIYSV
mgnify:CR=1 FL=1